MKANQNFRMEEEAVSPVIGVILMVAITVVLAAVVFVLVSDLGGGNDSAPAIAFNKNEGADRIEVVSASGSADWSRLSVRMSSGTCAGTINMGSAGAVHVNTVAQPGGSTISGAACAASAAAVSAAASVTAVLAGDYLDFCSNDPAAATNVVVLITDTVANSKVWEGTFSSISSCAASVLTFSATATPGQVVANTNGAYTWDVLTATIACTRPDTGGSIRMGGSGDANYYGDVAGSGGAEMTDPGNIDCGGIAPVVPIGTGPIVDGTFINFCYVTDAATGVQVTITGHAAVALVDPPVCP